MTHKNKACKEKKNMDRKLSCKKTEKSKKIKNNNNKIIIIIIIINFCF